MSKSAKIFAICLGVIFLAPTGLVSSDAFSQVIFKKRGKAPKPECFCTDTYGKRRELGDIICLTVGDRSYEAKCIMAQNNPFWRDLERGCLNSNLQQKNQTPFPKDFAALYQ